MKKINYNLFLMALCTISLGLFSASNPNNVEEPDDVDGGTTIKKRVTSGSQCTDFIKNNPGLAKVTRGRPKEGTNIKRKGGAKFFLSIGTDTVQVDTNNDFFAGALFDASIVANLKAKGELVKFLNQEMTSEIAQSVVQSKSTGEKNASISNDRANEIKPKTKDYNEMSLYEKTKVLINQQLDKAIDPETKAKINSDKVSDEDKEALVKDILNQKSFQDSISSKSQGTVRGMKTIASFVSAKPGDKKVNLCMINLWSEELQKKADAIASMDRSVLKGTRPGKPLMQQVPDIQTAEGALNVFSKFGTFVVKDEYGDLSVLSFAQEGCAQNCSSMSEEAAFNIASLKADRAIIQFREESIELQSNFDKESQASESRSTGNVDFYAKQNIENRWKASASGNLRGAYTLDQAMWTHPINGQETAIVIRAWTPSSQDFAGEIQESLDKQPDQKEVEFDYESNDYEDGGAMGLDDDDF